MTERLPPAILLVVATVVFFATDANACAVCMDAQEKNREAFVSMTWLLTFTPLLMIGGIAFYIARKVKNADGAGDDARRG